MKKYLMILPATLLSFGMAGSPATAGPVSGIPNIAADESLIEKAQGYHRDCAWVNNKWTYRRGDKMLVCRPHRPEGRGWSWRTEGPRIGWYHSGRKNWHHHN